MPITGHTRVFALLGHPVRHSLSPAMHTALFREHAVDAVYVAFDVPPTRAGNLASAVRTLGLAGANLTVPFKAQILAELDHMTAAAREAWAANVVIQHDGFLTGYNTDGEGFVRAWEHDFGACPTGHVVVLGAGGAARAIIASLADRGTSRFTLLNRSPGRRESVAAHLRVELPGLAIDTGPLDAPSFAAVCGDADAVVNCTAGPAAPLVSTFDITRLPAAAVWSDINYWMEAAPCVEACRHAGLRVQTGLDMLFQQGALSFELFTGLPVDPQAIATLLR
jgi:shikimate dehydrogenase